MEEGFSWREDTLPVEIVKEIFRYVTAPSAPLLHKPKIFYHPQQALCRLVCHWWKDQILQSPPPYPPTFFFIPMAIECFGSDCRISLLQWAREAGCGWGRGAWAAAAYVGRIDILEWLRDQGCFYEKNAFYAAARAGRVEVLDWLKADRSEFVKTIIDKNVEPWEKRFYEIESDKLTSMAVETGRVEVLEWLKANAGESILSEIWLDPRCLLLTAAKEGYIHLLEWYYNNHTDAHPYQMGYVVEGAAEGGRMDVIRWLEQTFPTTLNNHIPRQALERGACSASVEVLAWLKARGCPCLYIVWGNAVEKGSMEVWEWLKREFPTEFHEASVYTWVSAAERGDSLEVMEWLFNQEGKPRFLEFENRYNRMGLDTAVQSAARLGHLHVLKWMREKGVFPFENSLIRSAVEGGHLDVLTWLIEIGCKPHEVGHLICTAASHGHIELLKWFQENGHVLMGEGEVDPWLEQKEYLCSCAAQKGQLHVIKWLRMQAGFSWDETTSADAADSEDGPTFEWLLANGCPFNRISYTNMWEQLHNH